MRLSGGSATVIGVGAWRVRLDVCHRWERIDGVD